MSKEETWEPTCHLRQNFKVTHYEWTTQYTRRGTKVLEQKWVSNLGNEEWREVEEIETKPEGTITYYG